MIKTNEINYNHKWYIMAAVAMSSFLAGIDGSIVNVALPTLVDVLQTNFAIVQWVVLAYLLTITTLILGIGRLADIRGKKSLYSAGFVLFTIGSVLCGLAPTISWLIGFRVLQAIGAALTIALAMAIITESFPSTERGRALGIIGAVVSTGYIVGPTIGGFLIDLLSWRWIFFINLPVGLLGIWLALRYIPAIPSKGGQTFDYWGNTTLFISLFALLSALTLGQEHGFNDSLVWLMLTTWLAFLIIFIVIELNTNQPMLDLTIFHNSRLTIGLITLFLSSIALTGSFILLPFYLQNIMGYGTLQVGVLLIVVPLGLGITSPISGALSDRFGTSPIIMMGLILQLIGYYGITLLTTETTILNYILYLLPIGLGVGIFVSPNSSAIMGAALPQQLGIVSSLQSASRALGKSIGVAIIGAVWAIRVFFHAGETVHGGVTAASTNAQMVALQETFSGLVVIIVVALILNIWGIIQERHLQKKGLSVLKRQLL